MTSKSEYKLPSGNCRVQVVISVSLGHCADTFVDLCCLLESSSVVSKSECYVKG